MTGDRIIEPSQENYLIDTNTWFELHSRLLYNWKSPQHNSINTVRNQFVHFLGNHGFGSVVSPVKSSPGADVGWHHNLQLFSTQDQKSWETIELKYNQITNKMKITFITTTTNHSKSYHWKIIGWGKSTIVGIYKTSEKENNT